MKFVLVTGSRHYRGRAVESALNTHRPDVVIHGDATGADALAEEWARHNKVEVCRFPADWAMYGRRAGPVRNRAMCEALARSRAAGADVWVLAFVAADSRGTKDCIRTAMSLGLLVQEYWI